MERTDVNNNSETDATVDNYFLLEDIHLLKMSENLFSTIKMLKLWLWKKSQLVIAVVVAGKLLQLLLLARVAQLIIRLRVKVLLHTEPDKFL